MTRRAVPAASIVGVAARANDRKNLKSTDAGQCRPGLDTKVRVGELARRLSPPLHAPWPSRPCQFLRAGRSRRPTWASRRRRRRWRGEGGGPGASFDNPGSGAALFCAARPPSTPPPPVWQRQRKGLCHPLSTLTHRTSLRGGAIVSDGPTRRFRKTRAQTPNGWRRRPRPQPRWGAERERVKPRSTPALCSGRRVQPGRRGGRPVSFLVR